MSRHQIEAEPVAPADFPSSEPLLERLHQPEAALTNLARLAGVDESALEVEGGWAARVAVDGVALLVRSDGARWEVLAPGDGDEADATLAARTLHGLLGEQDEGWDLDR